MRKWTGVIIDDQRAAIDHLLDLLQDIEFIDIIDEFTTEKEARRFLQSNPVDFLILDMELANSTGFEFLNTLANPKIPTILYTSFQKYEDLGYDMSLVDVLLKEVSKSRLMGALRRLNKQLSGLIAAPEVRLDDNYSYFLLKGPVRNQRRMIEWKNIIYIMTEDKKVTIYMVGGQTEVSAKTFRETKDLLPREWFKHCAQGVLFNRNFFYQYIEGRVILNIKRNGKYIALPVGNKAIYQAFYSFLEIDVEK